MIFTVSGLPRCGTSMMMRALHAGGIPVPEITLDSEYMELPRSVIDVGIDNFYDGKLVKIFANRIDVLREMCDYSTIFMLRDPEDILDSYWARYPHGAPGVDFPKEKGLVHKLQVHTLKAWMDRPNIDVVPLDYDDVVKHPDIFMQGLRSRGWPINPNAAYKNIMLGATNKIIVPH